MAPEDAAEIKRLAKRTYRLMVWIFVSVLLGAGTITVLAVTNRADIDNIEENYAKYSDMLTLYGKTEFLLGEHNATLGTYILANDRDKEDIKVLLLEQRAELNTHMQFHMKAVYGTPRGVKAEEEPMYTEIAE